MSEVSLLPPPELLPNFPKGKKGKKGKNCAPQHQNQLQATNDLQAVQEWANEYRHTQNTFKAYRKEASRLLLWCRWQQKQLSDLTKADFAQYFDFLANPKPKKMWCGPKGDKPFTGPLSISSQKTSITIIKSLMNYLVEAGYLLTNPANLIKKHQHKAFGDNKYQVMARILEEGEWRAIQAALEAMPERTDKDKYKKRTAIFIISFLFLTGARIHELENLNWGAIRLYQDKWWLFVKGKGDREGMVPINDALLNHIKIYRLYHGLSILPEIDELRPVMLNRQREGLKKSQIYNVVKEVGKNAAALVENPHSKGKLLKFSPHWLRHLSASQQDRIGVPLKHIKENHRHISEQTTQIYIHSEQNERHKQLQKLVAPVQAKQFKDIGEKKTMMLNIQLKPKNRFVVDVEWVFLAIEIMVLRGAILKKEVADEGVTYVLDPSKLPPGNIMERIKNEAELRFCDVVCDIY